MAALNFESNKIGIIGSGLIGRQWTILFASAGFDVCIYDVDTKLLESTCTLIATQLEELNKQGVTRGTLTIEQKLEHISTTSDLETCLQDALYVQECVPESLALKRAVFQQVDDVISGGTIVASSTSTLSPSSFMDGLNNNDRFLVAHPVNPPILVPLVEVVPSKWTGRETLQLTLRIQNRIGQSPVVLNKEIPGFAVNRLQYALFVECANMIKEGVMSCEDLDKVMSEGLGMRYAFMGPLQTAHLNASGWKHYMELYGESINSVLSTFNPPSRLEGAGVNTIIEEMASLIPVEEIPERRKWRDQKLAQLAKIKQSSDDQ